MGQPLALRSDFTGADLKRLARESRDADQTRRLLALAVIYDGGSRAEAAGTGGVGRQIVRDWVLRFNAEGPDGLLTRKAPGNPSKLDDARAVPNSRRSSNAARSRPSTRWCAGG
jgi:transposase